jgi:hypothetical protein
MTKPLDHFAFAICGLRGLDLAEPEVCYSSAFGVTVQRKGHIYIYQRDSGGLFKASFHADGTCHLAVPDETHRKTGLPNAARHFRRWELDPTSSAPAFRMLIPWTEMRPGRSDLGDLSTLTLIPAGLFGTTHEITLHFAPWNKSRTASADHFSSSQSNVRFLAVANLLNGFSALLMLRVRPYNPDLQHRLAMSRVEALRLAHAGHSRHALEFITFDDGVHGCIDIALD